ncbi:MAG: glycosyltransferase family 2 protein [Pseudomonadota bacterium]
MALHESLHVSVVIAAHNAQHTLARAIHSALTEPETVEVIVVDDASDDDTRLVTMREAERDARVRLIPLDVNGGPGAARNHALDVAIAPYVAILDSDDVFLPGRLNRLVRAQDAEIVADNIAFANEADLERMVARDWSAIEPVFKDLSATEFVRGNLKRPGVARGELGFLKPVLSQRFLDRHKLRYDPALRLGEDYDLYTRMFLAGARMRLTSRPGYGAVVRANSLSAVHGADELSQLHDRLEGHLGAGTLSASLSRAMRTHRDEVRRKRDHRVFLDLRKQVGNRAALRYLLGAFNRPFPITLQIAKDKLRRVPKAGDAVAGDGIRLLLPA